MKEEEGRQRIFNITIIIFIISILLIIIVLSFLATGIDFTKEPIKGDKGDSGINGIDGKDAVFEYRWNGTNLQIKNSDGTWGKTIYLKGEKGDKGASGVTGSSGPRGPSGKDCEPNIEPATTLEYINGTRISQCTKYTKFTFYLNVSINDVDNDDFKVVFHYREDENQSWVSYETFFGENGLYGTEIIFEYNYNVIYKTIYWLVEVWDGSDITLSCYEFTA